MTKFAFLFAALILAGFSAQAEETEKYRCTSDSPKIERMTVIYADAHVHGELSYTYYLDVVDATGKSRRYWIENAETITPTSFAGRFTEFGSKADVLVNVDPAGKRTEVSKTILDGEAIQTFCVSLPSEIM